MNEYCNLDFFIDHVIGTNKFYKLPTTKKIFIVKKFLEIKISLEEEL
jgi:hypothetical protein